MPTKISDKAELARLWTAGVTAIAIGELFGCEPKTVSLTATALGLPGRGRGGYRRRAPEPQAPRRPGYETLLAIATDEGLTLRQATQRFHRVRATQASE